MTQMGHVWEAAIITIFRGLLKALDLGKVKAVLGSSRYKASLCSSSVIFLPSWRELSYLSEEKKQKKTSESRRHTFPEHKLCPFLDHVLGKQVLAFPSEWTKLASRARKGLLPGSVLPQMAQIPGAKSRQLFSREELLGVFGRVSVGPAVST